MRENKVSNSSSQCAQVFNYVISFLRPQKKEEKKNCEIKKATRKKKNIAPIWMEFSFA
jgi:hypothetical protein